MSARSAQHQRGYIPALLSWAVAALFVALAVYALGGRIGASMLAGREDMVAALLSELVGLEVEVGRVQGRFIGWSPVLELRDVALTPVGADDSGVESAEVVAADPEGAESAGADAPGPTPAVRVGRMRLALDPFESLLRRHAVAEALVVEDADVALARRPDGSWGLRAGRGGALPPPARIVDFLYHSDYVDLRRARLILEEPGRAAERLTLHGGLINHGGQHRGHLEVAYLPGRVGDEEVAAEAVGEVFVSMRGNDPLDAASRRGELLVTLDAVALTPVARRLLGGDPVASGMLDRLRLRLRFDPASGLRLRADGRARALVVGRDDPVRLSAARFGLEGRLTRERSGWLHFSELTGRLGDEPVALGGLDAGWRWRDGERDWFLRMPSFEAAAASRLLLGLDVLGSRTSRWLDRLAPAGTVAATHLFVAEERGRFAASFRLRDLDVNAYKGVPEVEDVDVRAVVHEGGGWLELDSGPFGVHFPAVFDQGWRYDAGRGRIAMRFGPEAVHLAGHRLEVTGPFGRASGEFGLYLPRDESRRTLTLLLGLQDVDASQARAYLPRRLQPALRGWLLDAIGSGDVRRGGVVINGSLAPGARDARSAAMFFDVTGGDLRFDPAWPRATGLAGRVVLDEDGARARLTQGRLGPFALGGAQVSVPRVDGRSSHVEIVGAARAEAAAALDFLRTSPVAAAVAPADLGWSARGTVGVDYDLRLALDRRAAEPAPPERLVLDLQLALSELEATELDLRAREVGGTLRYRHPGELASRNLRAELFGGPARLRIEGESRPPSGNENGPAPGALRVRIDGEGRGSELAEWLDQARLDGLDGDFGYDARLRWGLPGELRVVVEADTGALRTGLPAPLDTPGEALYLEAEQAGGALSAVVRWGALAAEAHLREGELAAASFGYGLRPPKLPETGILGRVRAPRLELADWLELLGPKRDASAVAELEALAGRGPRLPDPVDVGVEVADARWGDRRLGTSAMRITGREGDLAVRFTTAPADGELVIPGGAQPLGLRLKRLELPMPATATGASASSADDEGVAAVVDAAQPPNASSRAAPAAEGPSPIAGPASPAAPPVPPPAGLPLVAGAAAGRGPTSEPQAEPGAAVGARPDSATTGADVEGDELAAAELVTALLPPTLDTGRLPPVDVVIESFSAGGEDLGRATFALRPDARGLSIEQIHASGRGLHLVPTEEMPARLIWTMRPAVRTELRGRFSGSDLGEVLARWGLAPTIDSEEFAFGVDLSWPGAPDQLDPAAVQGEVHIDIERGRFVQIDAGTAPLRVVGLFNFAALARRMRLDFTDLYKKGLAFEDIDGSLVFADGVIRTRGPLRIEGPSSSFRISGTLDLDARRLDGEMIVTLPVSRNLPWYAAYAAFLANPLAGAGVIVAERIFREQIDKFSSARYRIGGSLEQPEVTFVTIFQNEIDEKTPPDTLADARTAGELASSGDEGEAGTGRGETGERGEKSERPGGGEADRGADEAPEIERPRLDRPARDHREAAPSSGGPFGDGASAEGPPSGGEVLPPAPAVGPLESALSPAELPYAVARRQRAGRYGFPGGSSPGSRHPGASMEGRATVAAGRSAAPAPGASDDRPTG